MSTTKASPTYSMPDKSQFNVGAIVGRFQVHELHEAHLELINEVRLAHPRLIIFLGVAPTVGTKTNPLDFESRKTMIQSAFPEATILPIPDQRNDSDWSQDLDRRLNEVLPPMSKVLLYGGRDSFLAHYSGRYKTTELQQDTFVSGTAIRSKISKKVLDSPEFRAGVIYACANRWPVAWPCVDIAPTRNGNELLLAQKAGEGKWRFIGGHVDPKDTTFEKAADREYNEETGGGRLNLDTIQYVCSMKIDDWRHTAGPDGIVTTLFQAEHLMGPTIPSDDISMLSWIPFSKLPDVHMVDEHIVLMFEFMRKNKICLMTENVKETEVVL